MERRTKEEKCVEWRRLHSPSSRGKGDMFGGGGEGNERACVEWRTEEGEEVVEGGGSTSGDDDFDLRV